MLPNCEAWFKSKENFNSIKHVLTLSKDSDIINELNIDLGLNKQVIY